MVINQQNIAHRVEELRRLDYVTQSLKGGINLRKDTILGQLSLRLEELIVSSLDEGDP